MRTKYLQLISINDLNLLVSLNIRKYTVYSIQSECTLYTIHMYSRWWEGAFSKGPGVVGQTFFARVFLPSPSPY
jgi:hypothetical protein